MGATFTLSPVVECLRPKPLPHQRVPLWRTLRRMRAPEASTRCGARWLIAGVAEVVAGAGRGSAEVTGINGVRLAVKVDLSAAGHKTPQLIGGVMRLRRRSHHPLGLSWQRVGNASRPEHLTKIRVRFRDLVDDEVRRLLADIELVLTHVGSFLKTSVRMDLVRLPLSLPSRVGGFVPAQTELALNSCARSLAWRWLLGCCAAVALRSGSR